MGSVGDNLAARGFDALAPLYTSKTAINIA